MPLLCGAPRRAFDDSNIQPAATPALASGPGSIADATAPGPANRIRGLSAIDGFPAADDSCGPAACGHFFEIRPLLWSLREFALPLFLCRPLFFRLSPP